MASSTQITSTKGYIVTAMKQSGNAFPIKRFPIKLGVVGISLTERCNAACAICLRESGPHRGGDVREEEAVRWIQQAAKLPDAPSVCFGGGEPFLKFALMERLTRQAVDLGIKVAVVTNAYWAKDQNRASDVIGKLCAAGLAHLAISTDDFHQKFVPVQRVDFAIGAAREHGLRCNLKYVLNGENGEKEVHTKLHQTLRNYEYLETVDTYTAVPVGRGTTLDVKSRGATWFSDACDAVARALVIGIKGETYACCGFGGFTQPLSLGNANERSLHDLQVAACASALVRALAMHGPAYVARLAGIELTCETTQFINDCHLCNFLLANRHTADIIDQAVQQHRAIFDMEYAYFSATAEAI